MPNWDDIDIWDSLNTWDGDLLTTPVAVAQPTAARPIPDLKPPHIFWDIDGSEVELDERWSATAIANGGYDQLREAWMKRKDWRKLVASGQGSLITGRQETGEYIYQGSMTSNPVIADDEQAMFTGQGPHVRLADKIARVLIRSDDMDIWLPLDGMPFLGVNGDPRYAHNQKIDVSIGTRIVWKVDKGVSIPANVAAGAGFWAEGTELRRIQFIPDWDDSDATANIVIRLSASNGPTGAGAIVFGWAAIAANKGQVIAHAIPTGFDMAQLLLFTAGAINPPDPGRYRASNIKMYSNIGPGDAGDWDVYNAWEIIRYTALQMGWDPSGIQHSDFNVLPFDWNQGEDWHAMDDYVADLEDYNYGVWEDQGAGHLVTYRPWNEHIYTAFRDQTDVQLEPQRVYTQARVNFSTARGLNRNVIANGPPNVANESAMVGIDLEDTQPDLSFPTLVAQRAIARYSRQVYRGTLDAKTLWDDAGRPNVYGVRPGFGVRLADFDTGSAYLGRVMETEMSVNGTIVGVEQPVNLPALIERAARWKRHHRRWRP